MTSRLEGVCCVWYYHLPWVSDDGELDDLVRESLGPLVSTHRDLAAPVVLALTGALLERLADRHPDLLETLRQLVHRGTVELAGTFFHEILPPLLPVGELEAHLVHDLDLKESLFDRRPVCFLPGNYTWVPSLGLLLPRHGIRRAFLDGGHLHRATAVQRWRWSVDETTEFADSLVPLGLARESLHLAYRLKMNDTTDRDELVVLFRDTRAVETISTGQRGALHRPLEKAARDTALRELQGQSGVVTLVDDGDRVNALSAFGYRRWIEALRPHLVLGETAAARPTRQLDYLPGYSVADLERFWLAGPDARHWVRLLDEIRRSPVAAKEDRRFLRLHDVFPLFWRNHWRCRLFWSEALEMLSAG